MKVIISAGGTGGHIYPALAIINKIKSEEPNSEILYIGTHNRMEKDIIPKHNIPFVTLEVYGFYRKKIYKNFKVLTKLISSYFKAKNIIKKFDPDLVIGVGGYVTVPVILSAKRLKYKTVIHEQNSVPGLSNKILSLFSSKILVSFPSSSNLFPAKKTEITGNPCAEDAVLKEPFKKEELSLSNNKKLVYIVMGSLGSSTISNFMIDTLKLFENKKYEVVFVTGSSSYETVIENKFPENVKIFKYIDNQTRAFKIADIIVTRCGASTLSEIIALKKPSILIPSPHVPNNHQYKNAMDLVNEKAAALILEEELKGSRLVDEIDDLINDSNKLINMSKNLSKLDITDSATKIYNIIKGMI